MISESVSPANVEKVSQPLLGSVPYLPSMRGLEVMIDLLVACISFAGAFVLFQHLHPEGYLAYPARHVVAAAAMFSLITVLFLERSGAYRASGGLLRIRETACILEAGTFSALTILLCCGLFGDLQWAVFSVVEVAISVALLILEKSLLHSLVARVHKRGVRLKRVLIYGSTVPAKRLYAALSRSPKLGLHPVAVVNSEGSRKDKQVDDNGGRTSRFDLSPSADLHAAMTFAHPVDIVLLTNRPTSEAELTIVMEETRRANAALIFAADPELVDTASIEYLDLDGHLIYGLHEVRPRQTHDFASRMLDICVTSMLLVSVAPLLALTCLVVKLDSPGPVFFRQTRVGRGGRPFTIIKFRTMFIESCGSRVSPMDSSDPRITRAGRWLRKTSIDELPQLINVLMGQMALVGPRPEMPFIVDRYTPEQRQRLSVRPGLTGLWQLSADRCRPIHENLHYDFYYLRRRSIFVDAAILFHTLLYAMHGT